MTRIKRDARPTPAIFRNTTRLDSSVRSHRRQRGAGDERIVPIAQKTKAAFESSKPDFADGHRPNAQHETNNIGENANLPGDKVNPLRNADDERHYEELKTEQQIHRARTCIFEQEDNSGTCEGGHYQGNVFFAGERH